MFMCGLRVLIVSDYVFLKYLYNGNKGKINYSIDKVNTEM